MNWKKFTIFWSSFLLLFFGETIYVFSCGPEPDPYDYYVNFFNPNLTDRKGFEPFFYTSLSIYYGMETPTEEALNLEEWGAFFRGNTTEKDIREFVYTYSRAQMAALYQSIEKNAALMAPDSVQKNTVTQYFIRNRDRETLGYLMYARQCEAYAGGDEGKAWNEPEVNAPVMQKLAKNGIQLYKACKDERIRERYAFQVTRMMHYSKDFEQAIHYYDSLAAPIRSTSLIHYKALALKAGALMRTGKKTQSAYLFSRIFENAPSQRTLAFQNTGWAGAAEEDVMRLCTNDHEKGTVAALYACRNAEPYPDGLRKVYHLDPKSPMLEVLLTREINKLEDRYFDAFINTYGYGSDAQNRKGMPMALQPLVDSLATGGKVKEPALWHISSAYLSFMMQDYAGANKRLNLARSGNNRPVIQNQWEIVKLLVSVNEQPHINSDLESKLLESFRWLDKKTGGSKKNGWYGSTPGNDEDMDSLFYTRMYRNLLDYVIAERYGKQGDMARKALIYCKRDQVSAYQIRYGAESATGFIRDSMQTEQMLHLYELKRSKRKTPFESYLCEQLMSAEDIAEAIAVNCTRQHDFKQAVAWFGRSGGEFAHSNEVFNDQLEDYGYESNDTTQPKGISEMAFAQRMVELEKKMKGRKADPKVYYEYATGLFSISYYGHSYHFSVDYRPSTSWYSPSDDANPFRKQYFGCYRAEEYYRKAAEASNDREFKARSLYMAARCAQKHLPPDDKDHSWHMAAIYENPYFPALSKDYKDTEFYKEIVGKCSYLRDYVRAQQKK